MADSGVEDAEGPADEAAEVAPPPSPHARALQSYQQELREEDDRVLSAARQLTRSPVQRLPESVLEQESATSGAVTAAPYDRDDSAGGATSEGSAAEEYERQVRFGRWAGRGQHLLTCAMHAAPALDRN